MRRKIFTIGFSAIMILSALVVMNIVPIANVSAGEAGNIPTQIATFPPMDIYENTRGGGDWIINSLGGVVTYSDCIIVLNSNLTIQAGGDLVFDNVNLIVNGTYDGEFGITVEDGIAAPQTTFTIQNNCVLNASIAPLNPSGPYGWGFVVGGPSVFSMTDSTLQDCGWGNVDPDYEDSGLNIQTSGATITGNDIYDSFRGINLHGVTAIGAIVSYNTIYDCDATGIWASENSTGHTISNNDIYNSENGIMFWDTFNTDIMNNDIYTNIFQGIYIGDSTDITISNNFVDDNTYSGIYTYNSDIIDIFDNVVINHLENGIYLDSSFNVEVDGNYVNYTDNGIPTDGLGRALEASYSTNVTITNNRLNYNDYTGIALFGPLGLNTVDNNWVWNTTLWGMADVEDFTRTTTITNNHIDEADRGLQIQDAWGTVVENNVIENCGSGAIQNTGGLITYGEITITPSIITEDIIYRNNVVRDCYAVFPTSSVAGHFVQNAVNITIENDAYENNQVNFHVSTDSTDVLLVNSTLTAGGVTDYDVVVADDAQGQDDAHATLLNTTFDPLLVEDVGGSSSSLTVQWYMHVKVQDGGTGVNGADVYVYDSLGGEDPSGGVQPFTTSTINGDPGWVVDIPVTEYINYSMSRTDYTPHDVLATTGSKEGTANPTMDDTKSIIIDLNTVPWINSLDPVGGSNVYRTFTLVVETDSQDGAGEDDEDQLTPSFSYRENGTNPWVNDTDVGSYLDEFSKTFANNNHQIDFIPPADAQIDDYDFRVRVQDTYGSFSDWFIVTDMVDVLNNPPEGEDIYDGDGEVPRGEDETIWADGFDIEDIDDEFFLDAEFQHRLDGGNWGTTYLGTPLLDINDDWRVIFTPTATRPDPNPGPVDFRVRFQDADGELSDWYEVLDLVTVLNNAPEANGFSKQAGSVLRGDTVRVYVDASDVEELEGDLNAHFEYRHQDSPDWEATWLSPNGDYDGTDLYADFTPPYTAALGNYEFRVTITDSDADSVLFIPGGNIIVVNNNLPTVSSISSSASGVRAGTTTPIYLEVQASDGNENTEAELKVYSSADDIQWQYTGPTGGSPTGVWQSTYFGASMYDGTPPSGYIKVPFQPDGSASEGVYIFQVRVTDQDGGKSGYIQMSQTVTVYPPNPEIIDVTPQNDEVYRGETVVIVINGYDALDSEDALTPHLEMDPPGATSWTEITVTYSYNYIDDQWDLLFEPDDSYGVGNYQFRGWVTNPSGGESTKMDASTFITVMNNLPSADDLRGPTGISTVERGDSVWIYADGSDYENTEGQLTPEFMHSSNNGATYNDDYFDLASISYSSGSWRISFEPPDDADAGQYYFKVSFEDEEGESSTDLEEANMIEVLNVKPTVLDLSGPRSGYRGDTIYITANGSDESTTEGALDVQFQVKYESGSFADVDSSQYYNNYHRVSYTPSSSDELGPYSFQVRFQDEEDEWSDWYAQNDYFTLKNSLPTVDITAPIDIEQTNSKVTFTVDGYDEEDTSLTYSWDFGDGGTTDTTEDTVTHEYTGQGSFLVTVIVEDSDGGKSTATKTITIPRDAVGGDDGGGLDMMTLIMILLPLIIVIVVLIVLLTRKKKKPEEVPPAAPMAAPAAAPGVEAAPAAAPAAVPMAAPAAAVPAAIPAAIPAAAPAAAPKEGAKAGQKIKCPKCGNGFAVESTERPITIECPSCGAKGKLT